MVGTRIEGQPGKEGGREGEEEGEGGEVRSSGWASWPGGNTEPWVSEPLGPSWPSHTSAPPHDLSERSERHHH